MAELTASRAETDPQGMYQERLAALEPASMHEEVPCWWSKAQGCSVWDLNDRQYLDGCSGIFAVNCGHAHPYIANQIMAALDRGLIHSYLYPTTLRLALLARLQRLFHYDQAFLCTTGSEAVEAALRIARTRERRWVVSLEQCFHGKTQGARALRYGGPDVVQLSLQCTQYSHVVDRLRFLRVDPEQVAAFIVEPYQGWSARLLNPQLIEAITVTARTWGTLVIADEVQAGMGRTGRWWGSQHLGYPVYEYRPDLIVCGKALGNGVPVAAVLGSTELLARVPDLSATHSGHPLGCAAALATLEVLETERLVDRARVLGQRIAPRLRAIQAAYPELVTDVAGVGAVWALHIHMKVMADWENVALANEIVDAAFRRGLLLVRTHAGTVKVGPPLTVTGPELDAMLGILAAAVAEVAG